METVMTVFWVLVLISLIAIPFLKKSNDEREERERLKLWAQWSIEAEHEELAECIDYTIKRTLNEIFQNEEEEV